MFVGASGWVRREVIGPYRRTPPHHTTSQSRPISVRTPSHPTAAHQNDRHTPSIFFSIQTKTFSC